MKVSPAYFGVFPDFLSLEKKYTKESYQEKRDIVIQWCKDNCQDKFLPSHIHPWAFLNEDDAKQFSLKFGGEIKYKPEECFD